MNLKEGYRYSNFLESLLVKTIGYLQNERFTTTVTQEHLRNKVNKDAIDEITIAEKPYDMCFSPNDLINFAVKVLNERENLFNAISLAKRNAEIDIDNAVSMNKKRQSFIGVLSIMTALKPGTKTVSGRAYKFDVNGTQCPYVYDIIETTSIDFDRNDVKGLIKKYNKICDDTSNLLDSIEINTYLDFEPTWDIADSFEDIVVGSR